MPRSSQRFLTTVISDVSGEQVFHRVLRFGFHCVSSHHSPANARSPALMFPAVCLDFRRPMWTEIILKMFFFLKPIALSLSTPEKICLSATFAGAFGSSSDIVPPHFVSAHSCDIRSASPTNRLISRSSVLLRSGPKNSYTSFARPAWITH